MLSSLLAWPKKGRLFLSIAFVFFACFSLHSRVPLYYSSSAAEQLKNIQHSRQRQAEEDQSHTAITPPQLQVFLKCLSEIAPGSFFISQGTLLKSLRYGGPVPTPYGEEREDSDVDLFVFYDGNIAAVHRMTQSILGCLLTSEHYKKGEFYWGTWRGIPTFYRLVHTPDAFMFPKGYELHFITRDGDIFTSVTNKTFANANFFGNSVAESAGTYLGYVFGAWGGKLPARILFDSQGNLGRCKYGNVTVGCPHNFLEYLIGVEACEYFDEGNLSQLWFPKVGNITQKQCIFTSRRIKTATAKLSLMGFLSFTDLISPTDQTQRDFEVVKTQVDKGCKQYEKYNPAAPRRMARLRAATSHHNASLCHALITQGIGGGGH